MYYLLLKVNHDPYSSVAEATSPKALSYSGEVTISLRASQETGRIVLHMDRSIVLSETPLVQTSTGQTIPVIRTNYDNFQFFDIILSSGLQAGTDYNLTMKFSTKTTRDGFYYHGYQELGQRELVFNKFFNFLN